MSPHPVYRTLVRLYPRKFRRRYAHDLVQQYADLVRERGARVAWTRTTLDLFVTVPRYRLESIMSERLSGSTLNVVIVLLVAGGLLSYVAGFPAGLILLVAAIVLAVTQRSALARAIRTPDTGKRRRRLITAAVLAVIFAGSIASYMRAIGNEHVGGLSLVLHNAIGVPAMIGTVVFLVIGLLTPRDAGRRPSAAG